MGRIQNRVEMKGMFRETWTRLGGRNEKVFKRWIIGRGVLNYS